MVRALAVERARLEFLEQNDMVETERARQRAPRCCPPDNGAGRRWLRLSKLDHFERAADARGRSGLADASGLQRIGKFSEPSCAGNRHQSKHTTPMLCRCGGMCGSMGTSSRNSARGQQFQTGEHHQRSRRSGSRTDREARGNSPRSTSRLSPLPRSSSAIGLQPSRSGSRNYRP